MYFKFSVYCWYLLIIGELIEELVDMAECVKSRDIQVGQNLHQDLQWQPADKDMKRVMKMGRDTTDLTL